MNNTDLPPLPQPPEDADYYYSYSETTPRHMTGPGAVPRGAAPSLQTPKPVQDLLIRLQGDLVVAHRVAGRLREERDRAWAEARQLRADLAHSEQQWRHDFMEVQNELNKEKRARLDLEKILEETISTASHYEADLTASKIRERVMQRQLARASASFPSAASTPSGSARRHGVRSRTSLYASIEPPRRDASLLIGANNHELEGTFSSVGLGLNDTPTHDVGDVNVVRPSGSYSSQSNGPHLSSASKDLHPDVADSDKNVQSDGSAAGAEADDMVAVLEQLEYMNARLASLHSDNLGLRKLLDAVKQERDELYGRFASLDPQDNMTKEDLNGSHDLSGGSLPTAAAAVPGGGGVLSVEGAVGTRRSATNEQGVAAASSGLMPSDAPVRQPEDSASPPPPDAAHLAAQITMQLQAEIDAHKETLRRERASAEIIAAKMEDEISSLKSQLKNVRLVSSQSSFLGSHPPARPGVLSPAPSSSAGEQEGEWQLLVQQLRCEVDSAEARGLERLRRVQCVVRDQAETIDILTRALQQQHRPFQPLAS